MISIVICSVQPERLQAVAANIASTIGVEHELIAIDNRIEGRGLCEVYNEGASRASYDFICFVHEDVEFLSEGWGVRALAHFTADADLGLVGLAGSRYKAKVPSGWHCGDKRDICINILHGSSREAAVAGFCKPEALADASSIPVVAIDGVWMLVRRSVWSAVRFDEARKGFHFYDVDFSLRVSQAAKVAVIYDVDLLHFSLGSFGEAWASKALDYAASPPFPFPAGVSGAIKNGRSKEILAVRYWLRLLRRARLPLSLRLRWLRASGVYRYPSQWRFALRFLLS